CEGGDYAVRDPDGEFVISANWVASCRFESGGGSFNQAIPNYAAIDLEQFVAMPVKPTPTMDDVAALRELLKVLRAFPSDATLTTARKSIGPLAGANQYQRQQTIETLSTVGILKPAAFDSFLTRYT